MGRDEKRGDRWMEHVVTAEEAGRTVQQIVQGPLAVSRRMIQRLTRSGGIRLNGRSPHLAGRVRAGDRVRVRVSEAEAPELTPVEMPLTVVHEDDTLMVLDKPPFLLVHPIGREGVPTLAHGVAHHLASHGVQSRVRPLHRLDRDTSGLVVFAGSAYAHQHLDRQLRDGTLEREYLAFVSGVVREDRGEVRAPIGPRPGQPHLRTVREDGDAAVTRFRVVARGDDATLLEVSLETGRTHQIRVHLSHLGHPLLGDRQYGAAPSHDIRRQALHAHRLTLRHPLDDRVCCFQSELPADLARLRDRLEPGTRP
jgi:23S rRNA pseudouridine1911/1915/1917 synthase